jgi:hypothetical protein
MRLQIDQSGKIEQTNKKTVLCLSNKEWYALVIPGKVKRQVQEVFRRHGQIRNFILFTFCAGIALLLQKARPKTKVIIDEEYIGKSPIIKNILGEMLADIKLIPNITFEFIGKHSHAHLLAKEVMLKHKKPTWIVKTKEIFREIKKTEVGKRLKNA